jgi:hypothetical protein
MKLKCVWVPEKSMWYSDVALTVGKIYQGSPVCSDSSYNIKFLVFADNGKWQVCPKKSFVPVEEG